MCARENVEHNETNIQIDFVAQSADRPEKLKIIFGLLKTKGIH